jgi:CRP-like cAMP-binding protein
MKRVQFFRERNVRDADYPFIIEALKYQFFKRDETIMNWGDLGDKFYIIIKGSVKVLVPALRLRDGKDLMQ